VAEAARRRVFARTEEAALLGSVDRANRAFSAIA
jgi:hypothetical protein